MLKFKENWDDDDYDSGDYDSGANHDWNSTPDDDDWMGDPDIDGYDDDERV